MQPATPARLRPRRLRVPRLLAVLGPGLIAASAGNDAGGIATYAQAGAAWRYDFVWLMVVITFCLIIVQEMCSRMGAVTGKGLVDLIREKFGVRLTLFAIVAILIANGGTVVSEFAGAAAALEMFGISRYISVPIAACFLWFLVVKGNYARVEWVFLGFSAVFLVYVPAAFLAHPDWHALFVAAIHPHFHFDKSGYLLELVALIGTTITPYMQIMLQSSVAEKGIREEDYTATSRIDTIVGCIWGDLVSVFIIVATAQALFKGMGVVSLDTAQQAAQALEPAAGPLAKYLFSAGLLGASLLAGAYLPLSTCYAICESLGFQNGVSNDFKDARVFYVLYTTILAGGALLSLIPGVPLVQLLVYVQAINCLILPIILVFIMLIINDREVMPRMRNGRLFNLVAWTTTAVIGTVALVYVFLNNILPLFGIHLS